MAKIYWKSLFGTKKEITINEAKQMAISYSKGITTTSDKKKKASLVNKHLIGTTCQKLGVVSKL